MVDLLDFASDGRWRPVGILDERLTVGRLLDNVPILGRIGDYRQVMSGLALRGIRPHRILITAAADRVGQAALHRLHGQAGADGVTVTDIFGLLGFGGPQAMIADEGGLAPAGCPELGQTGYAAGKRLFDILVSLAVLVATAPLLALAALALRGSIGSPVLFHQLRGGRGGRAFLMVKFRTMREAYGADGRLLADELRTPWLGRMMRRSRSDELPQLWNVLIGNMSIVGPRPLFARSWRSCRTGVPSVRRSGRGSPAGRRCMAGSSSTCLQRRRSTPGTCGMPPWPWTARILLLTVRMVIRGESRRRRALARVQAAHAAVGSG